MTDDLMVQAEAAIAVRREMLAAGTPGPWDCDEGDVGSGDNWVCYRPFGAGFENPDMPLIVAMHAAFAAATDHAESVLGRHRPDPDGVSPYCEAEHGDSGERYPCPDARDALGQLGVSVDG